MLKQGFKVNLDNLNNNPSCPHGPTLRFQRLKNGQPPGREFFSCSAYRDRKDCNFFHWVDESISSGMIKIWQNEILKFQPPEDFESLHSELRQFRQHPAANLAFCNSCSRVVELSAVNQDHKGHSILASVTPQQLCQPTTLLRPLQEDSGEAQYYFDSGALRFLEQTLENLNADSVVCVGTPRLMEHLNSIPKYEDRVYLLDLDWRLAMFHGDHFSWYNMFNHHFLSSKGDPKACLSRNRFLEFLKRSKNPGSFNIVIDPPFGGRVEPLSNTLKCLAQEIRNIGSTQDVYFLWAYPYFMETYITSSLPGVQMLDFKVDYANHADYNARSRRGKKLGSPVRFFTNAPLHLITMPKSEGYHWCGQCKKYVSRENRHCEFCKACTSKDGRTYMHCKKCCRCVKPTYQHCTKCGRCHLPKPDCGTVVLRQTNTKSRKRKGTLGSLSKRAHKK